MARRGKGRSGSKRSRGNGRPKQSPADQGRTAEERARREEAKRERRRERQAREADERRRARRNRRLLTGAAILIAVVALGGFIAYLLWPDPELEGVERPPDEGREHLAEGATYDYGDPAPTSGPHDPRAPDCRVYAEPLELTLAVHALEHGVVVLWYRPDVEDDALSDLRAIMNAHDSHVIVSPNPGIDDAVVATAWNRRMAFDDASDSTIAEFVDVYRQRGPESVDCPI